MKVLFLISLLFFFLCREGDAQYYDTGQDPASIKWMQIKTGRFTVIYPESYGKEGVKFAKSLDNSFTRLASLFPEKKFRIPVIIHNYTTFSNGYVSWAPRRMEIYPTPEQNGIPLDPIEQLTTHELTHVLQMVSLNKGFTKIMSLISGEQFTGAVSALLPLWFMEGDAVFAESLLSPSGRGKTPSFLKQMKAIALENPRMYSYDKMIAGSFKKFIPDHYQYGYQMVAWSSARYGPSIWNKAVDFTGKYPFTIVPVNLSLHKSAGLTKSKLYSETFDSLKTIWETERKQIDPANYKELNSPKGRNFVNYYSPVVTGKDSIIAIKTSFSSSPEFVLINPSDRSEKRIHIPGSIYPWVISGSNGKITWVENRPDPRWENRTYSVIKIMDLHQNIARQLSYKTRYLGASLSSDGRMIAAVENTISNENSLIIIDAFNGDVLSRVPVPGNAYAQRPQWSVNGSEISIISLSDKGEGIMSYSVSNQAWTTLRDPGRNDLQSAFMRNDSLFFVSSSSGTDNAYLLTPDKRVLQLTNSKYGAYDPALAGGNIVFSDYSASGYNICIAGLSDGKEYKETQQRDPAFLINRFDTIKIKDTGESTDKYKPQPYRKAGHLLKFHSWMPFYADIEQIQANPASVRPGFTIMTQNQLSTLISTIGYEYSADKQHLLHTRITWKGWYPVIESQIDYGGNAGVAKLGSTVANPVTIQPGLSFRSTVSLPLNFSTGRFTQFLQPSVSAEYDNTYIWVRERAMYDYGQSIITGRLYFTNYCNSALRDIYPKWAQVIDLNSTSAPFDKEIYGTRNTFKTAFYFPGLFRNQGIRIRYESEIQNPQKLLYYNRASLPRSYKNIIPEKINFISGDYAIPLLYPDLNVPGVIFIQRIRTSFFYDYARGSKNHYLDTRQFHNYTETFRSFGSELWADFYLLRIPFMVSTGVQATWRSSRDLPVFEFLFNVNVFGNKIGRTRS